ncbi:hypothetical protein NQ317_015406, partial [Molorchus minor]
MVNLSRNDKETLMILGWLDQLFRYCPIDSDYFAAIRRSMLGDLYVQFSEYYENCHGWNLLVSDRDLRKTLRYTFTREVLRKAGGLPKEPATLAKYANYAGAANYLYLEPGPCSTVPRNTRNTGDYTPGGDDVCINVMAARRRLGFGRRSRKIKDNQLVGVVYLIGHEVKKLDYGLVEGNIKDNQFVIQRANEVPLYLATDTIDIRERWIEIIQKSDIRCFYTRNKKNLLLPPSEIAFPDCFGYLVKLGNQWKSRSRRYCVLKDASLFFYHDIKSDNAF